MTFNRPKSERARLDVCRHGVNEIGEPYISSEGTWFRFDIWTSAANGEEHKERRFAAGRYDYSPMFIDGDNGKYDSTCSCCYLGFSHTVNCHGNKIASEGGR